MFPAVAGVQPKTSRSIKPRERDLGDLRLFFLVRILTRPTNHPRHAACASNYESKPVRPHLNREQIIPSSDAGRNAISAAAGSAGSDQIPGTFAREQTPNLRPASLGRARCGELQTPSNPIKIQITTRVCPRGSHA